MRTSTRTLFIKSTLAVAIGAAALGLAGCSATENEAPSTDTEETILTGETEKPEPGILTGETEKPTEETILTGETEKPTDLTGQTQESILTGETEEP